MSSRYQKPEKAPASSASKERSKAGVGSNAGGVNKKTPLSATTTSLPEKLTSRTGPQDGSKGGRSQTTRAKTAGGNAKQGTDSVVVDLNDSDGSGAGKAETATPGVTVTQHTGGVSETQPSAQSLAPQHKDNETTSDTNGRKVKELSNPKNKTSQLKGQHSELNGNAKGNTHKLQSKPPQSSTKASNGAKDTTKQGRRTDVSQTPAAGDDPAPRSATSAARERWDMINPKEVIAMAACENWDKPNGNLAAPNPEVVRGTHLDLPSATAADADNVSIMSRQTSLRSFDSKSIDMSRVQAAIDAAAAAASNNNNNDAKNEKPKASLAASHDTLIRSAIPYLPVWLAVICFICNIILPGMGELKSRTNITCELESSRDTSLKCA